MSRKSSMMNIQMSVVFLLLLYGQYLCSPTPETPEEEEEEDTEFSGPFPTGGSLQVNSRILQNSPRFVVKLPDKNLFCFSVEGFELFTYNLITSDYLALNGFLNLSSLFREDNDSDEPPLLRGFTDIGVNIMSADSRSRGGMRILRHTVYGSKEKVVLEKFGEVDLHQGAIVFNLENGHSNIESENSKHEQFRVVLDKPKCDVLVISGGGRLFTVYVEDSSGLQEMKTHGLIGQFLNSTVRIDTAQSKLFRATGPPVDVEKGTIWDNLRDEVLASDQECWYPVDEEENVIQGEVWEYIVEHLHAKKFKYSLFR